MDLKRKRGRPKGSKSQAKVPETKKSKADEGTLAKNQVRSSGEMSLRPNKRVRVSWFKKLQGMVTVALFLALFLTFVLHIDHFLNQMAGEEDYVHRSTLKF